MCVGVCVGAVWLWGLLKCEAEAVWEGGANLRGLIMTPYHSRQELPPLAHHITCMAWHENRRCMSFLTRLAIYMAAGGTWTQGLREKPQAGLPALFKPKKWMSWYIEQYLLFCFFSFVRFSIGPSSFLEKKEADILPFPTAYSTGYQLPRWTKESIH